MTAHQWKPIEPLSDRDRAIDLAAIQPLYESWRAAKKKLLDTSPASLKKFTERQIRRLSVETGILERLYDLDRGTTEALVESGFMEELISHGSTDIGSSRLIDLLHDQEAAVQLVIDCVTRKRSLTHGVVHEFHAIMTRHQETTEAVDQHGHRMEIALLRGRYKEQPNSPKRPDGSIHEYCPPLQVESEMDNLLRWYKTYDLEDPVIVSAWLHHRFTQIHPYQDGNGRLGRLLTTLVLLRSDLLPLVIDRDLRTPYLQALEAADAGDLTDLADLFARLERSAILGALSVDIDAEAAKERSLTSAVISHLDAKLKRRKAAEHTELRRVNDLAQILRSRAQGSVDSAFGELKLAVATIDTPSVRISEGGPDQGNAHWYKHQVIHSGGESGRFVNFNEAHYFVKATLRVAQDRLRFVTSFHHVGRELAGIMEATAFAILDVVEDSAEQEDTASEFFPCSVEPYVFTHRTHEDQVVASFERWIDAALAVAIKEYGDRL